jgi:hypothetical protein
MSTLSSIDRLFESGDQWFQLNGRNLCPIPIHKKNEEPGSLKQNLYTRKVCDPSGTTYLLTVQYKDSKYAADEVGFYSSLSSNNYHYFQETYTKNWHAKILNASQAKKVFNKYCASVGVKDRNEEKK